MSEVINKAGRAVRQRERMGHVNASLESFELISCHPWHIGSPKMPFSLGQQWGLQENQLVRCRCPQGEASLVKMMDEEMLGLLPKQGSQLQIRGPALPPGAGCAQHRVLRAGAPP